MSFPGWRCRGVCGVEVSEEGIDVEESVNKLGQVNYQAKLTFRGPLGLARQNLDARRVLSRVIAGLKAGAL